MSTRERLEHIVIEPKQQAKASVIWLHGLGADGHDFEPIVPELEIPDSCAVRFIFPHAPMMPVTINGGYPMRAWYDIVSADIDAQVDEENILNSVKSITQLIDTEIDNSIPAEKIFLVGFSQGGVMALQAGLRYPKKIAGTIALSCYLPLVERLQKEASSANQNTPILQAHGSSDPIVAIDRGRKAYDQLTDLNYRVDWHEYEMDHSVCLDEIQLIGGFIQEQLGD